MISVDIHDRKMPYEPGKKRLTVDCYLGYPNNGKCVQLIDGDLIVTPAPSLYHQQISRNIQQILYEAVGETGSGGVFNAPVDFFVDRYNVVQPDIAYVSAKRYGELSKRGIEGAPDLVVEILSPHTRKVDLTSKQELYWRVSVKELWIVDPDAETVDVYRYSQQEGWVLLKNCRLDAGDRLVSEQLPQLDAGLERVFEIPWKAQAEAREREAGPTPTE